MIALVAWSYAAAAALMTVLWWRQRESRNATSVDVAWSGLIGAICLVYAALADGDPMRRALVGLLGAGWAFRLFLHLWADRVRGHHTEDGRYAAMRESWGPSADKYFFVVYQIQALVAVIFTLPLLGAMRGGALAPITIGGVAIWLIAVGGETLADRQLARFRAVPEHRGQVCRDGLWYYSRHPNYFFEWLHWWSYVLIGQGALLTWIGPVAMFLFVYRLTGIPHTERQAIRSRGDAYREYQRTTSAFFPWPPKTGSR